MTPDEVDRLDELAWHRVKQFREEGDAAALDIAIDLRRTSAAATPPGTYEHADRCAWLAGDLLVRFETFGDEADIDEAVVSAADAVAGAVGYAEEASHLRRHGVCLLARYEHSGRADDLVLALARLAAAVQRADADQRWKYLSSLGHAHTVAFSTTADPDALERAVDVLRESVRLVSEDEPQRSFCLGNLANALCVRYDERGAASDLDEAVSLAELAANVADGMERAHWHSVLGSALQMRFTRRESEEDLRAATHWLTCSVEATPDWHPEKPRRLHGLGVVHGERFEVTNDLSCLEDARSAHAAAVTLSQPTDPERPSWEASLGNSYLKLFGQHGRDDDLDESIRLLAGAVRDMHEDHPHLANWRGAYARALLARFDSRGHAGDLDDAVTAQIGAVEATDRGHRLWPTRLGDLGDMLLRRYEARGSGADLEPARSLLRSAVASAAEDDSQIVDALTSLASLLHTTYLRTFDPELLNEAIDIGFRVMTMTGSSWPAKANNLATYLLTRFEISDDPDDTLTAAEMLTTALAAVAEGARIRAELLLNSGWAWLLLYQRPQHGTNPVPPEEVEHVLATFRLVLDVEGASQDTKDTARMLFARTSRLRYSRSGQAEHHDALVDAERELRAAVDRRAQARGDHVRAALLGEHAKVLRELGRHTDAYETAHELIRSRTWEVIAQSGTVDAVRSSRSAVEEASTLATWYIDDDDAGRAITAVESARALSVHSVTSHTRISDLLRDGGFTDLIEAWTIQPAIVEDSVPDNVRYRVLQVLSTAAPDEMATLLNSPTPEQMAAMCRELGVDALVYLVAGTATAGHALIVHASGCVSSIRLDGLRRRKRDSFARFLTAHGQHLGSDESEVVREWRRAFGQVLNWMWRGAMRQVLARVRSEVPRGRPPRVVLVPTGSLGLLPWHAARRKRGGRYRYALEDAVISYTPSAKVLQWFADSEPLARDGRGLVIADPTHDLSHARVEAVELYETHYRDGVMLGGTGDEHLQPATPADVLTALTDAPVVHFACHAVATAPATESHLLLAGSGKLTVGTLLRHGRRQGAGGSLVVLSGCATAVPLDQYDESLSLATAFAAIGASAVVGSLWPIHDNATADLMRRFHESLNVGDMAPADALRHAQLAVLDNARSRRQPSGNAPESADKPWLWASFVHFGQNAGHNLNATAHRSTQSSESSSQPVP